MLARQSTGDTGSISIECDKGLVPKTRVIKAGYGNHAPLAWIILMYVRNSQRACHDRELDETLCKR